MSTENFGFIAAFLTTIAFLPQVLRIIRTRSADDVSILMLVLFISGLLFWVVYGIRAHARPVLVANTITLILNISILGMKIFYTNNIKLFT